MSDCYLKRVLVITGSPRIESRSARLAKHLYERLKQEDGFEVSLLDVRDFKLPQFETVFETVETTPEIFRADAENFLSADAYIVVRPEYNGSFTSALQNLFDHFPRQQRKVYGVVTATNYGRYACKSAVVIANHCIVRNSFPLHAHNTLCR